jgi:GAF domain-containing protein
VSFADRLPGGSLALDLEGRITFATAAAAGLLGSRAEDLIGALAPEALPWLDDPVFEDHYREALISGRPTAFAAVRPPDHRLSFRLYPDHTGVSVRVEAAPAAAGGEGGGRPAPPSRGPGRATALYQLMHLAATLAEAAGVRDVVDQAADQIMPAFGVRALALATVLDGRLRVVGHRGVPPDVLARFDGVPLGSPSPVARVLDTGQAGFYATFAELREDYPDVVRPRGMSAWAFLPLTASDHVLGALVLGYDRPRRFPPEERAFLISLAGLVAQALDRALLYDARDRLARSLQSALLPHVLPDVPGLRVAARYVPALRGMGIGGDFYDVIRLGGAAAAAIGDVQGHNVTAAALMGQVRTAVHATAGASPGEVLARVNRLVTDLNPGLFTSCLYAHLDLDRHRVRLATAGHPPPLLRHPGGHAEVLDLTPGLLLGIDPDAEYPTTEIALPPGAVLALYTDGLVEAPGGDIGDAIAGLAGRLSGGGGPSPDTLDGLAATLLEHARASVPGGDDMALLLLGPAGHPIGPGTA